jgi:hypothetical protein
MKSPYEFSLAALLAPGARLEKGWPSGNRAAKNFVEIRIDNVVNRVFTD